MPRRIVPLGWIHATQFELDGWHKFAIQPSTDWIETPIHRSKTTTAIDRVFADFALPASSAQLSPQTFWSQYFIISAQFERFADWSLSTGLIIVKSTTSAAVPASAANAKWLITTIILFSCKIALRKGEISSGEIAEARGLQNNLRETNPRFVSLTLAAYFASTPWVASSQPRPN